MRTAILSSVLLAAAAAFSRAAVVGPAEARAPIGGAGAVGAPARTTTAVPGVLPLAAPVLLAPSPSLSPPVAPSAAGTPEAAPPHVAAAPTPKAASAPALAARRAASAPSTAPDGSAKPAASRRSGLRERAPADVAPAADARSWAESRAESDALFDGSAARKAAAEPAAATEAAAAAGKASAPRRLARSAAPPSAGSRDAASPPAPGPGAGVTTPRRPWWLIPRDAPQMLSMSAAAALAGILAACLVGLVAAGAGGALGLGPVLAGSGQVTGLFMGLVANGLFSLSLFPYYLASLVHEYGHYRFARWAGIETPARYRDFQSFGPGELDDDHAPIYPRDRRQHAWWLLGGPAFNLAAGGAVLAAAAALGTLLGPATHALNFLFVTLLVWALWNLTMGIGALLPIREGRGGHRLIQVLGGSDDVRYVTKTRAQLRREWARWRAGRKRALPDFYP